MSRDKLYASQRPDPPRPSIWQRFAALPFWHRLAIVVVVAMLVVAVVRG